MIAQAVCETLFWFGLDGSLTKAMPRPQEIGVEASRSLAVPKSTTLSEVLRSASWFVMLGWFLGGAASHGLARGYYRTEGSVGLSLGFLVGFGGWFLEVNLGVSCKTRTSPNAPCSSSSGGTN